MYTVLSTPDILGGVVDEQILQPDRNLDYRSLITAVYN